MILVSATAFGTNAILAKLAYREGLGTSQTLAFRFVLAAFGMWGLALVLRQNPLRFERLRLLTLLALGGVFYFAQSLTYFTALRTLPASLCVLIAYIYPSLVVVAGGVCLFRALAGLLPLVFASLLFCVALAPRFRHLPCQGQVFLCV